MEKILSQEERIKRAEEIYARRQNLRERTRNATVNIGEPKNLRLFKKLILQIIICMLIYFIFYLIDTTNYSFSEITLNKTDELISHDIDFFTIYNNVIETINNHISSFEGKNEQENITNIEENKEDEKINNEIENNQEEKNNSEVVIDTIEEVNEEETTTQKEISFVEQSETDRIKNKYLFILPIERNCFF